MRKILFIFAAVLLSSVGLHAGNTITYYASDRLLRNELKEGATTFGPEITRHSFSNGKGEIECNGNITKIGANAFAGFSNLTSVELPDWYVTTIGESAFQNCSGLTSITIPNSVTTIERLAFGYCSELKTVTMSDAVTSIGARAFIYCAKLDSITIPSPVTEIGEMVFYECTRLVKIYCYAPVPPSLGLSVFTNVPQDKLSVYVFDVDAYRRQWKQLKSECFKSLLPKDLEVDGIKYQLFFSNGCKARVIKKNSGYTDAISIPEQVTYKGVTFAVTEIGQDAFKNCSGLKTITIPNTVTAIGNGAFSDCSGLTSVAIPNSVTTIKQGAFNGCSGLLSLTIGNSVTTIGDGAFYGCTGLTKIGVASGNPKYDSRDCNAIIETATNTLIYGCKTTNIPSSVTTIGANAFAGCTGLTSIDIPSSVTTIGDGAFSHCALGAVTLPVSVMQIGKRAFEYCEQLKSVKLPSNLTLIDEGTFQHTGLESIVIPVSVKRIENYAFDACRLNYVECIPETPPTLGSTNTFTKNDTAIVYVPTPEATVAYRSSDWTKYFTKIYSYITYRQTSSNTVEVIDALPIDKKVEIPAMFASAGTFYKVTGIGERAFKNKTSLHSISLPPTIQYIDNSAFNGCVNLKDINIEYMEDLQTIGDSAFYNCSALDSIVIPEGVQTLGKAAFMNCSRLTYVSLPTGLKNIPDDCFRHCYNLRDELIIPEGVDTIGVYAFNTDTLLRKVYLPSTLKEFRYGAFAGTALREVICLAPTPPTLTGATFGTKGSALSVYLPNRDVISTYKNNSQWWRNPGYTGCRVEFFDLMAEANMKYLYEVAGNNAKAKEIAQSYCDSIRKATTTLQVQRYTAAALERIDKLTLTDYKKALADSLDHYAKVYGENIEAKQIANQYGPQIKNATSRPAAEQLFAEAYMKITDIYELIELKKNYKKQLIDLAGGDNDLLKVATDYGALIDRAETKEDARALYERATMRMNINKQINHDWNGGSVKVNDRTCTTTKGYK